MRSCISLQQRFTVPMNSAEQPSDGQLICNAKPLLLAPLLLVISQAEDRPGTTYFCHHIYTIMSWLQCSMADSTEQCSDGLVACKEHSSSSVRNGGNLYVMRVV